MTDSNKLNVLFTEIMRGLVANSAIAFSPDNNDETSLIMWTGGSSRDNRIGSLSLKFKSEHDGRIRFSININQKNLKTKRTSIPMSGDYFLDDKIFYERLNTTLERFGGQKPSEPICKVV